MAVSLTLTRVDRPASGGYFVYFGDSSSIEQVDLASLVAFSESPPGDDLDRVRKDLVRYWLRRDPTATNDNVVEGKTCTLDFAQNGPVEDIS